MMVGFARTFI